MKRITSVRELEVYKLAFKTAMEIFEISKKFPKEEQYSLTDQIRRSSRSICSNLSEAWRKRRYKAVFINKLSDAAQEEGAETQTWLEFALACKYIDKNTFSNFDEQYEHIFAMLYAMQNKADTFCNNRPSSFVLANEVSGRPSEHKGVIVMRLLITLTITAVTLLYPLTTFATVPRLINYQAKLTNAAGEPLDGAYDITFKIYDAETAGNLLWQETHAGLVVRQGLFSVLLGSVAPLSLPFTQNYWLAIKVGNDSEMTPRQQIAASGYAINSEHAENADKIKASASDTTSEYLSDTTDNLSLEVDPATQKLQIKNSGVSYGKLDDDSHERMVKAWVNFNGEGTVYIRDSYNVSSIVDNGVGKYTINWDKDFSNANYAMAVTGSITSTDVDPNYPPTVGAAWVRSMEEDSGTMHFYDSKYMYVIAIGDQ